MALSEEQRRIICGIARKYGVMNVRVFGSIARGEQTSNSDIDLLVVTPAGFTLFDLAAFKPELDDATRCKVDVASERGLKPRIREHILAKARPL